MIKILQVSLLLTICSTILFPQKRISKSLINDFYTYVEQLKTFKFKSNDLFSFTKSNTAILLFPKGTHTPSIILDMNSYYFKNSSWII